MPEPTQQSAEQKSAPAKQKSPKDTQQSAEQKATGAGVSITYKPGREDPVEVTWNKIKFEANKPRVVSDPRIIARAKTNPWFEVAGEKRAEKGFDPAVDEPTNATQYRAYAITWFKDSKLTSAVMAKRWNAEEELRVTLGVGQDDLDYIAKFYDPRFEQLKRSETAGEAQ